MTPGLPAQVASAWMRVCPTHLPAGIPAARKRNILVADDNPQIRQSLRKVLCAEGYGVTLAMDGREVLGKFDTEQIDMLLLDLVLPDISGWDIFGMVSARHPFVPVVIITGRAEQLELALLCGVSALAEKPLDVPVLLRAIGELFAEPAETHFKQMFGLSGHIRHVQPMHLDLTNLRARDK